MQNKIIIIHLMFIVLLGAACQPSPEGALSLSPAAPVAPPPVLAITSVSPTASGTAGGTTITIRGTEFSAGMGILIGTLSCGTINVVSSTQATCVVPAQAASTVNISVTTSNGASATANNAFMYADSFPPPVISSISATTGSAGGGQSLTINGSNFWSGATVLMGSLNCTSPNVVSVSLIMCTIPAGAVGTVNVTVRNPDAQTHTLNSAYTYTTPPTYTQLKANVTTSRCSSCHGTSGGFSTENHASILSRTIAGNPAGSTLYQRVANNSMPTSGGPLTDAQKQMIFDWIQNGSLND